MNVLPDEIVQLVGRGTLTARSAVRIVMQEWSAGERDTARAVKQAVIFREGDPSILTIGDIEQLWSQSEFN